MGSSTPVTTLAFPATIVGSGGAVNITASLGVTDVGSTAISGWTLTNLTYPLTGTGWSLAVSQTPVIAGGGLATLTFTLTGTAGSSSIDLSGVTCTLTPIGP